MIPYRSNILTEAPRSFEKRLEIADAIRRLAAQRQDDSRSIGNNATRGEAEQSEQAKRETYREIAALWLALMRKYSPDQPRVPAGSRDGGQWTKGEGDSAEASAAPMHPNDSIIIRPVASQLDQTAALETGATTDSESRTSEQQMAIRVSPEQEVECDEQFARDTFHCNMVGLAGCHAQAMLRYSNCLRGLPIPPLNY